MSERMSIDEAFGGYGERGRELDREIAELGREIEEAARPERCSENDDEEST